RPKRLLRSVAAARLPSELLRLPKRGFSAPVGAWVGKQYAARFEDEVLGRGSAVGSWIDLARVRVLFDQHRSGTRDHSSALWSIWMLERWARMDAQRQARVHEPGVRATHTM